MSRHLSTEIRVPIDSDNPEIIVDLLRSEEHTSELQSL